MRPHGEHPCPWGHARPEFGCFGCLTAVAADAAVAEAAAAAAAMGVGFDSCMLDESRAASARAQRRLASLRAAGEDACHGCYGSGKHLDDYGWRVEPLDFGPCWHCGGTGRRKKDAA